MYFFSLHLIGWKHLLFIFHLWKLCPVQIQISALRISLGKMLPASISGKWEVRGPLPTCKYWLMLSQVSQWQAWPSCNSLSHSKTITALRGSHQRLPEETCFEMKEKIITVINCAKRKGKLFLFGKVSNVEEKWGEKARREDDKVSHVRLIVHS